MFPPKAAGFTPVSPMDNQLLCERVEVVTVPAQETRARIILLAIVILLFFLSSHTIERAPVCDKV